MHCHQIGHTLLLLNLEVFSVAVVCVWMGSLFCLTRLFSLRFNGDLSVNKWGLTKSNSKVALKARFSSVDLQIKVRKGSKMSWNNPINSADFQQHLRLLFYIFSIENNADTFPYFGSNAIWMPPVSHTTLNVSRFWRRCRSFVQCILFPAKHHHDSVLKLMILNYIDERIYDAICTNHVHRETVQWTYNRKKPENYEWIWWKGSGVEPFYKAILREKCSLFLCLVSQNLI